MNGDLLWCTGESSFLWEIKIGALVGKKGWWKKRWLLFLHPKLGCLSKLIRGESLGSFCRQEWFSLCVYIRNFGVYIDRDVRWGWPRVQKKQPCSLVPSKQTNSWTNTADQPADEFHRMKPMAALNFLLKSGYLWKKDFVVRHLSVEHTVRKSSSPGVRTSDWRKNFWLKKKLLSLMAQTIFSWKKKYDISNTILAASMHQTLRAE